MSDTHDSGSTTLVKAPQRRREDALRAENEALQSRLRQVEVQFGRLTAIHERHAREDREATRAEIVAKLLPTLDSLQLATLSVAHEPRLRVGLLITWHELAHTLESIGIVTHSPRMGDEFDPNVHEAVSYEEAPAAQDGTILAVFREGYSLEGRLLRPALVTVARAISMPRLSGVPGEGSGPG
jgi:molecular chaperone GrpE